MKKRALALAVLTTLLWSGSYIVNKTAFAQGIGPLTLSGLRYTLGSLALMLTVKREKGKTFPLPLALLQGALCFLIGQGFQYIGQSLTQPTMASLILNSALVLFVAAADRIRLHEAPGKSMYWKITLLIVGMLAYYAPWSGGMPDVAPMAWVVLILAAFGAAMNVVLNRLRFLQGYERRTVTVRPMFFGGLMMLAAGLVTETLPTFSWLLVGCVAYLALISGALGFGLWIWSQQTLTAVESGAINNLMIVEIALMDVLFFGRSIAPAQWLGILLVFAAIQLLQTRPSRD